MDAKQLARQELDKLDEVMLRLVMEAKAVGITADELRAFFKTVKEEKDNGKI